MTEADYIKKLERRIHNQRVRLRWFEKETDMHLRYFRRGWFSLHKQLIDLGHKPKVWRPVYRIPQKAIATEETSQSPAE